MATPTITDTLAELLERVRKAEGEDRRLDLAIACALDAEATPHPTLAPEVYAHPKAVDIAGYETPYLSSSLDACLSLLGEVLPEYYPEMRLELCEGNFKTRGEWDHATAIIDVSPKPAGTVSGASSFSREAPTLPIALLDCILQALLNQEAIKEKTDAGR